MVKLICTALCVPLLLIVGANAGAQVTDREDLYSIRTQHQPDDQVAKQEYYSPALLVVESKPVITTACVDWSAARFCFDVDLHPPQVRINVYVYGYLVLNTTLDQHNACAKLTSPSIPGVKLEGKLCANFDSNEVYGSIKMCIVGVCKGLEGVLFRWGESASEPGVPSVSPLAPASFKFCNKDHDPEASFQVWFGCCIRRAEITLGKGKCGEVQVDAVWYDISVWTKKDGGSFIAQKSYQYADGRGWTLVRSGGFWELQDGASLPGAMACACKNWQCTKACPHPGKYCVGHQQCAPSPITLKMVY